MVSEQESLYKKITKVCFEHVNRISISILQYQEEIMVSFCGLEGEDGGCVAQKQNEGIHKQ